MNTPAQMDTAPKNEINVQLSKLADTVNTLKSMFENQGHHVVIEPLKSKNERGVIDITKPCDCSQHSMKKAVGAADRNAITNPACYIEMRIYRNNGTLYKIYYINGIDQPFNFPSSDSAYIYGNCHSYGTTSYCPTALDIEVEPQGHGTAFLTGVVKDATTGSPILDAGIMWSLGGDTTPAASGFTTGYFSTIVLPGEGLVTAIHPDYRINSRWTVLTSTKRRRIDINMYPL